MKGKKKKVTREKKKVIAKKTKGRKKISRQSQKQLKESYPMLYMMYGADVSTTRCLLKHCDDGIINSVCECVQNAMCNPQLMDSNSRLYLKKKLFPLKTEMRQFIKPNLSSNQRRGKAIQIGQGLRPILGVILPILHELLFPPPHQRQQQQ